MEVRGWLCREHFGTISHSIPIWQLQAGLGMAGHQAGGEGCVSSWWLMAGRCGVSSSALLALEHQGGLVLVPWEG